jgi:hypothetical protein
LNAGQAVVKKPLHHSDNRLAQFFATLEQRVTGETPKKPAQSPRELQDRVAQSATTKRLAWLSRPRLHTAIFAESLRDDEIAKFGAKPIGDALKQQRKRAQKITAITKQLRWSKERMGAFKRVVVDYRKNPTLENYLLVRREFPEVEIQIGEFGGIDALFTLENDFREQGVDPDLIAACLDADEPSIDALCLRLMEKLVEREKLSQGTPGYIQKRRAAISDALVNYLIVTILESFDWVEEEVRIPASLVVLIRHQLTGTNPDLHAAYLSREYKHNLAIMLAQILKPNDKLSINKLASIARIPRIRAARLLKDEDFMYWLELAKKWVAEGLFDKARR